MKQMPQNLKMVNVIPHLRQMEDHCSPALTKIVFRLYGTEVINVHDSAWELSEQIKQFCLNTILSFTFEGDEENH